MQPDSTRASLVLNVPALDALRGAHGIKTTGALATRIGVNKTTLYRIVSGHTKPSNEFIAGVKAAFPTASLDALFTVKKAA